MQEFDLKEQLKTATDALVDLENKIKSLTNALPDPIFIINEQGFYLEVLGGEEKSLYHDGKFLKGKYLHDILPKDLTDTFLSAIHESIQTKSLKTIEYQLSPDDVFGTQTDGPEDKQWFEGRIYPIQEILNSTPAVIWLAINITKRKQLEDKLKELSYTDSLTGVFNRRYFLHMFEKGFAAARRYRNNLSLLMIDIDHFKQVNDTYGHEVGDMALKACADACSSKLREVDLFARFGGEEFVVLLPNTPLSGAITMAERIRKAVNKIKLTVGGNKIQFSISVGVTSALATDTNIEDVIRRSDTALYEAKKGGRNRVVSLFL